MKLAAILDRPIAFHAVFARIAGSANAGLFLSQAIYWSNRSSNADGWFWKTAQDWALETSLSRYEQETARKLLKQIGVLQEQRRGVPARMFYRINFEALQRHLNDAPDPNFPPPANDNDIHPVNPPVESFSETAKDLSPRLRKSLMQVSQVTQNHQIDGFPHSGQKDPNNFQKPVKSSSLLETSKLECGFSTNILMTETTSETTQSDSYPQSFENSNVDSRNSPKTDCESKPISSSSELTVENSKSSPAIVAPAVSSVTPVAEASSKPNYQSYQPVTGSASCAPNNDLGGTLATGMNQNGEGVERWAGYAGGGSQEADPQQEYDITRSGSSVTSKRKEEGAFNGRKLSKAEWKKMAAIAYESLQPIHEAVCRAVSFNSVFSAVLQCVREALDLGMTLKLICCRYEKAAFQLHTSISDGGCVNPGGKLVSLFRATLIGC